MISYELAKQLKEAGFPQDGDIEQWENHGDNSGDGVFKPTLSELIEACGDEFESLSLHPYYDGDIYMVFGRNTLGFNGSTPEEAVANLYLALNKK